MVEKFVVNLLFDDKFLFKKNWIYLKVGYKYCLIIYVWYFVICIIKIYK